MAKIVNGRVVLGRKDCDHCEHQTPRGTMPAYVTCPTCNGTGRGPKGGRGGCKRCRDLRRVYDDTKRVPCYHCEGTWQVSPDGMSGGCAEGICDYMPRELWPTLTFKVYRNYRNLTIGEGLIGLGCVWSSPDSYPERMTDEQLIAEVRDGKHGGCQWSHITRDDGEFCDHIGICCAPVYGYTVKPMFKSAGGRMDGDRSGAIAAPQ